MLPRAVLTGRTRAVFRLPCTPLSLSVSSRLPLQRLLPFAAIRALSSSSLPQANSFVPNTKKIHHSPKATMSTPKVSMSTPPKAAMSTETTSPKTAAKNVVELMKEDHKVANSLFAQLKSATDPAQKQQIGFKLIRELAKHKFIEEEVVYPIYKTKMGAKGQEYYNRSLKEHLELEQSLAKLDSSNCDPKNPDTMALWETARKSLAEHIDEEENEIFPELEKALTTQELCEVGKKYEENKPNMPTRPHPGMAMAAGTWLADRALALKDQAMDAVRFGTDKTKLAGQAS